MSKPAYEALYETIRQEIISGIYPYGSKLPGKRDLAEQLGLSVITVAHALELLADEGYIQPKERSGCYVIYRVTDGYLGQDDSSPSTHAFPATSQLSGDLRSSADIEGFPFSVLARSMRRVITDHEESLLQRSPNQGLLSFRQVLSAYLARSRGIQASPDQIVIGAGAEYLYGLLTDILGKDQIWAIESPSYEQIERIYTARGIPLDYLPLERDGIRSESLWHTDASILHVSPYRSFPSDVTASASRRAEYLRWACEPARILIEDDYESEFSVQRKPMMTLFAQSNQNHVIYLNTFSRTISSSLRAGYLVLPSHLLSQYESRAGFYSCTVPTFEQLLLTDLINHGDFERHIRRVRRKLRATMEKP